MKLGKYFVHNNREYYQLLSPVILRAMNIIAKIPKVRALLKYCYVLLNAFLLQSRVNINNYDVIHGHSTFINGLSALLLARIHRKIFIYDIHALGIDAYNKKSIKYKLEKLLEGFIINRSDKIIVIDYKLKEHIQSIFNVDNKNVFVAPNGIDSSFFRKRKKDANLLHNYNIPLDKYLVGVDNSKPIEGFNFIYKNQKKIKKLIDNIHFIVFGNKENNLPQQNFTFLPNIEYRNMPVLYSVVDLFIIPRPKNAQTDTVTPLKLLELMSCEIPVIVSDVGGLTSCIKDNKTGFILKENDISSLIKIISYVQNKNISKITLNAKDWVKKNKSWEFAGQQYINCYNQLI